MGRVFDLLSKQNKQKIAVTGRDWTWPAGRDHQGAKHCYDRKQEIELSKMIQKVYQRKENRYSDLALMFTLSRLLKSDFIRFKHKWLADDDFSKSFSKFFLRLVRQH